MLLILGVTLIVAGVLSADWATSDNLMLQYHGWPESLRRSRQHRLFFHLLGITLVIAGIMPFLVLSLQAAASVVVILIGLFLLGVLQILPLIVFRTLETLRWMFRR